MRQEWECLKSSTVCRVSHRLARDDSDSIATFSVSSMYSRRLDDKIRLLCAQLAAATDDDVVDVLVPELRAVVRQSIQRIRKMLFGEMMTHPEGRKLPMGACRVALPNALDEKGA